MSEENELHEEIKAIFVESRKDTIKAYCDRTGQGLKESKYAVESIVEPLRNDHPERFKSSGCVAA